MSDLETEDGVLTEEESKQSIIDTLEELLVSARAGDIGFFAAAIDFKNDKCVCARVVGTVDRIKVLGSIEYLKSSFFNASYGKTAEVEGGVIT